MASPVELRIKAQNRLDQAQTLYDEFKGQRMPQEVADKINSLLGEAEAYKAEVDRKQAEIANSQPQYKGVNPLAAFSNTEIPEGGLSMDSTSGNGQTKLWTPASGRPL